MASNRSPLGVRLVRFVRLMLHLLRGVVMTWLRFPRLPESERHAEKRRWSKKVLSMLSVSVRDANLPQALPERCMLVMNHISWLDIFVINSRLPATFVAKSEIRDWPVVGGMCTRVGTLYIERGKRAAARRAREMLAEALAGGTLIAICPEGVTSFGRSLGRFHAALFQPAIDAGAMVQPVALRYVDSAGEHTDAAGYVGDATLLESVWTIVSTRHMVARLEFLSPFPAAGQTRRALAERTQNAIAGALGVAPPQLVSRATQVTHAPRTPPETGGDPPGVSH